MNMNLGRVGRAQAQRLAPGDASVWWLALAALVVLYVPSMVDLFRDIWGNGEQSQGPIILGVTCWLLWQRREALMALQTPGSASGWWMLVGSLLLFFVGRTQSIYLFELGAFPLVIMGALVVLKGWSAPRLVWFALVFSLFMVPLPSQVVDTLTQPMKIGVSMMSEWVLYQFGYPISRVGVLLHLGQYQLLVADACAGLHTMFTLEAMGLLYLNLVQYASPARNIALAIAVVPISFVANSIRVIVLCLITYHLGDEAGQGFLHGFAGMVLFMAALMLIIGADTLIRLFVSKPVPTRPAAEVRP